MTSGDMAVEIVGYPAKHLRVLGLAGSGKTRLVVERYKALVQAHGPGAAFVVTYSRDQLRRLTASLLDDGRGHDGLSPVLTHFTLAREILTAAGRKPPRIIDDLEESVLVHTIIGDNARQLTSDYKSIRDSKSFQEELLGVFHLFLQSGIEGDRLERLRAKASRDERLRDIVLLYEKYRAALAAARRVTYYDLSRVAVPACGELPRDHPLRQARAILVDDFQDIDAGQFELLTALAPAGGDVALNVFGDPMGAYFGFRGTRVRFLMEAFPAAHPCETLCIRGEATGDNRIDALLAASAREVLGSEAEAFLPPQEGAAEWGPLFEGARTGAARAVRLEIARDEVEEMYGAAARAHELLSGGAYRPHEIAVVTNDKRRYEPVLRAAFTQHGVPLNTGRSGQDAFRSFVHSLFVLLDSPRDAVALQALVTSPFYPAFKEQCLGIPAERRRDPAREAARAEKALRAATAVLPKGRERVPEIVASWLRPACDAYSEETGDEFVYGFLSLVARRWEEYIAAVEPFGHTPSVSDFIRITDVFGSTSSTPAPSADEVGFYSCRETRGRYFRCVLVLGCSELLFPSALRRESILPAAALQTLFDHAVPELHAKVHAARSALDHLHEEYHLLYHTVTRSREALYLSAPKKFNGQEFPAPAAILADVFEAAAREDVAARETTPPQIRFARAWVRQPSAPEMADRLGELSPFGRLWNLPPLAARPFAVERFPISKSSLETCAKCSRKFFYEKALRIRDEDKIAALVGGMFHEIMARIGKQFPDKRTIHREVTDAFIGDAIEEVIVGEHMEVGAFLHASLRVHLERMVRGALRLDAKESDDYTVSHVEEKFDFEHRGWKFTGKFDRIETTAAGGVVLDYKTGEFKKTAENLRERTLKVLDKPEAANWQVPVYVLAYRERFAKPPDAFTHLVQQPDEAPFFVTLYIRDSEADVPPEAFSRKRDHQGFSYLLIGEVEDIMKKAAATAAATFAEKTTFAKTPDEELCRNCSFVRVCDRRLD
jgi:superfamily I DNA/RNA helicase